jgi:HupE/UreJ protein
VHGFGFAGVLAELELPAARLVPALFGFNLGVELGQLAVVAVAWPALAAVVRASPQRWAPIVTGGGSAAICGLGVFWLVTRAFG